MFTIFSCIINVTVTSQNGVPSFHLHQRAYMWRGYAPKTIYPGPVPYFRGD